MQMFDYILHVQYFKKKKKDFFNSVCLSLSVRKLPKSLHDEHILRFMKHKDDLFPFIILLTYFINSIGVLKDI